MKLRDQKKLRQTLDQQIDAVMLDMAKQQSPSNRKPEFRISSFPYCPIRSLLFNDRRMNSYQMEFYTSIGHAVHETNQAWLTVGNFRGRIFACWKSKETGEIKGPCFYDDLPKKWLKKNTIKYEEITIKYRGLSGHIDLALEILPGMFIIIDWKTTSLALKKMKKSTWENDYPAERSSIMQISSYATLLRELFGLNVVAWCLIYVDRSKVIESKNDYHKILRPWSKAKHKKQLKFINESCDNNFRLKKLQRLLHQTDTYSEEAVKTLKAIIKHRPCQDEESYNAWMGYKFNRWSTDPKKGTKNGACILKEHCLQSHKASYKAVQRLL